MPFTLKSLMLSIASLSRGIRCESKPMISSDRLSKYTHYECASLAKRDTRRARLRADDALSTTLLDCHATMGRGSFWVRKRGSTYTESSSNLVHDRSYTKCPTMVTIIHQNPKPPPLPPRPLLFPPSPPTPKRLCTICWSLSAAPPMSAPSSRGRGSS